jgi:hypothetical protein
LPLTHTPLDPATLTDGARKALTGPEPLRMMAARGLAPLKPVELVSVLYGLALDSEAGIKAAADKTVAELPEKILGGALADAALDARVLDFFAARVHAKPALLEAVILNRATADVTVADLVPKLGDRELELVVVNEQRLLRHPAIIGALYMNPKARMSTVDRCIELAVRNQVTVPGIPSWNELVTAVLGAQAQPKPPAADVDATFQRVATVAIGEHKQFKGEVQEVVEDVEVLEVINQQEGEAVEEEKRNVPIDQLPIPAKIRLATLGNAFARAMLIRDSNKQVALAAVRSPGMTDNEIVKYSANRALYDDVIRVIASTREWTKLYQVKVNLANNPKCPISESMRLLPFLREKELKKLARSKGIPNAVVVQAKKLLVNKGSRG